MPDIASLLGGLRLQNEALSENLTAKGVPAAGSEGLVTLAEKVKRINQHIADGEKSTVVVSQGTPVLHAGAFIRLVPELTAVTNRGMEASCSVEASAYIGQKRVVTTLKKSGGLYLKAGGQEADGTLALGNSVRLTEDSTASSVTLLGLQDAAAAFYVSGGRGCFVYTTYEGLTGTLAYSGELADASGAEMLSVTALNGQRALVCYTAAGLLCAQVVAFGETGVAIHPVCILEEIAGLDAYTQGLSLAALSNSEAVLAFFMEHSEPVKLRLLTVSDGGEIEVEHYALGVTEGALPCLALCALGVNLVGLVGAVTRLGEENATYLTLEGWYGSKAVGLCPVFWGAEDVGGTGVSCVYADAFGNDAALLSCLQDGKLRGGVVSLNSGRPESCVTLPLADAGAYCRLHALNGSYALGIVEASGTVTIHLFRCDKKAVPCYDGSTADGLASTGGEAGEAIDIYLA